MSEVLSTSIGDLPLEEVQLAVGEREWSILHNGALITAGQELEFLVGDKQAKRPYGIVLWPSAIALAHELATRDLRGKRILELGAGTGLPGIIAASLGAHVVQTDRQNVALHVSKLNAARNKVALDQRIADWTEWTETEVFDLIIGSDILYAEPLHTHLEKIFAANLAPGGSIVIADPFRPASIRFFERLQTDGWKLQIDKWTIALTPPARNVGVFALTPPPR
ncbi:MAG TPA: 50S ribosomal protein L11 methyltransferase [Kofleriaceae bacterium]|jgi:predicted nicotinamide N-methyase